MTAESYWPGFGFDENQYPNQHNAHKHNAKQQHQHEQADTQQPIGFADLPLEILWIIFSHLDAKTLARASGVCQRWHLGANDDLIWSHLSNHAEKFCMSLCSCSLSRPLGTTRPSKRRFMQLLPDVGLTCERRAVENPLVNWFRIQRRQPWTVVMFGSGLEVPGSTLVSRLMWGDSTSPFVTLGMFPSTTANGIGGGVRLSFRSRVFNLIALYRNNKTARELRDEDGRPTVLHNHLIDTASALRATQSVCRKSDAFVYVYDASLPITNETVRDFHVLINDGAASTLPVLIFFLISDLNRVAVTSPELMNALQLPARSGRWWILTIDGSSNQLERGFDWLLPCARWL